MPAPSSPLQAISPAASHEEAAAIVAALEQFMRATAPAPAANARAQLDGWRAAAILEGTSRDPWGEAPSPALGNPLGNPWINT